MCFQKTLQDAEHALLVIQTAGGDELLIAAPDGGLFADAEEQVAAKDLVFCDLQLSGDQLFQHAFLGGTADNILYGANEEQKQKESPYCSAYFVLNDERSILYDRIDRRVDQMIRDGLVDEVFRLKEMGYTRDLVSMQGLGYKELFPYLAGECTLEEAVYIIKRDTRHFAKRQLTWLRGWSHPLTWLETGSQLNPDIILRDVGSCA